VEEERKMEKMNLTIEGIPAILYGSDDNINRSFTKGNNIYEKHTDCLLFTFRKHKELSIRNSKTDRWYFKRINS
jgi:hypothetical protein